jgi:23S rRNA (uracil1939-C5)-methyltransferase
MLRDPRWPRFVGSIELFTNETDVQLNVVDTARPVARRFFEWCAERIPGMVAGALDYPAAETSFRITRGSFFQANRFLVDRLVEVALEAAGGQTAVDLYAGVGLFSLPLARRCGTVAAVESGAGATADLEFNAARAGLSVNVSRALAEQYLETLETPPDFLLADPPRAGLGKGVVAHLARLRPPLLTIVACDPATLARDLAALVAAGYRIDHMTFVDLFPQTYHLETVVRLRLR